MTIRYCSPCAAQVEDVDGHCLLGHRFAAQAGWDSFGALRAEVDDVLEEARRQIAATVSAAGLPSPEESAPATIAAPGAPLPHQALRAGPPAPPLPAIPLPGVVIPAPPPPPARPEPVPDAAASGSATHPEGGLPDGGVGGGEITRRMWAKAENQATGPNDPIASFAPSPKMDWGPDRSMRFTRPFARRPAKVAAV